MVVYRVLYTKIAKKDAEKLKSSGLDIKVRKTIDKMRDDPFVVPPPYKVLTGDLKGAFSRRINIKYRLVYSVVKQKTKSAGIEYDGTVRILRMWTHYKGVTMVAY